MKMSPGAVLCGALLISICAGSAMATPVLFWTSDEKADATLAAEARFREFSNFIGGNNDFEMGIWRSGVGGWFDTQNYQNNGNGYTSDNLFTLAYDGGGNLTFTMDNQGGEVYQTTAAIGTALDLNFLQIQVRDSSNLPNFTGEVSLANLMFNGSTFGTGSLGAGFAAFSGDLNAAWTVTGNLLLSGDWSGSAEGNRVEFALGNLTTVIPLPGAAGMALAGMGMIGIRRRRSATPILDL